MKSEKWMHIEGSVYMSTESLSTTKVAHMLDRLLEKYPYITKCVREMHQADISDVHSLSAQFEYDGTPGKYVQKDADVKKEVSSHSQEPEKAKAQKRSLRDRVDAHKEMANQRNQQRQDKQPEKPKNHNQEL